MNKLYLILVVFAFSGLLFANMPTPSNAASDLNYMLTIAENANRYCKSQIETKTNLDPQIIALYGQSISEIDKLASAIELSDVKSAREYFVSSMQKMGKLSIMLSQTDPSITDDLPSNQNIVLDRYKTNLQKLKSISAKITANVDFKEMDDLMILAEQENSKGNYEQAKQVLEDIANKGMAIYKTLESINEQNKITRAKALAEKYVHQVNILIIQAQELGLQDSISKLEQSKVNLVSANNTSIIKQHIKIVIVLNQHIEKSKSDIMDKIKQNEIQLSKQQQLSIQIAHLENKAHTLYSNADGHNAATYYLEKAFSIIESTKHDLNDQSNDVTAKIKQIKDILSKVEKLLQEAA